jgi:uncharacterized membrane protein
MQSFFKTISVITIFLLALAHVKLSAQINRLLIISSAWILAHFRKTRPIHTIPVFKRVLMRVLAQLGLYQNWTMQLKLHRSLIT